MFPIVGIGASAGGLEALGNFVTQIPAKCGMAFVVVQHLERDRAELLVELLAARTALPVVEVSDGMVVEREHIYVAPPDRRLIMREGVLLQQASSPMEHFHAIDVFFQSLAVDRVDHAVGVIVSGNGNDGTLGMETIREQGGLTAVQEPSSARCPDMPLSCIRAGIADIIDLPENLPARIINTFESMAAQGRDGNGVADTDGRWLAEIQALVQQHTGQDFSAYKHNTLYRRIKRRMGLLRQSTIEEYCRFLEQRPEEGDALLKDLLISVTRFFRDGDVWERIEREVFPSLVSNARSGDTLRAWVQGCATGEEAYSLAISFCEAMERQGRAARSVGLQIFATDLNPRAIAVARRGVYPATINQQVPAAILKRYFTSDTEGYQVVKKIRDMVIFAPHNLLFDPPFSRLDILSCRNLLIYLAPEVHASVLERFHYSMNSQGYLLLGSSESIGPATHLFSALPGCGQIYRHIEGRPLEKQFSFLSYNTTSMPQTHSALMGNGLNSGYASDLKSISDRFVLQRFAPTAIIASENGDILHISGTPERFLQLSEGRADFNVMSLVRDALKLSLSEAFWNSRQLVDTVIVTVPWPDDTEGPDRKATQITVSPLVDPTAQPGMMMVLFNDVLLPSSLPGEEAGISNARENSRSLMLEQMLRQSRAALQATREEMQTSREELTSTNEELQSTNEELTTSAEELRTMNEELMRARSESEAVLARYADLFDSAPVGYFTLDRSGAIMQANLAGAALLDMERDRVAGSRLVMFVKEADRARFRECLENSFASTREQQCEIALWRDDAHPVHVRVSALAQRDGMSCRVVTADVTENKRAQLAVLESEESYRTLFEHSKDALLIVFNSDQPKFLSGNQRALELFGISEKDSLANITVEDLSTEYQPDGRLSTEKAEEMLTIAQQQGTHFFEWRHRRLDGSVFIAEVLLTALVIRGARVIQASIRDITTRRQTEDQLQLAAMVYQHSSEAMMVSDADDRIIAINQAFTRMTGYDENDALGQPTSILHRETSDTATLAMINEALQKHGSWHGELTGLRKNGDIFTQSITINTAWNDDGSVYRRVALFSDISEKKKNESLIWLQANYDGLTGKPNRRHFYERLNLEIKQSHRNNHSFVLLFIDLDRFKEVNDALGHDMGDILLKQAADRLHTCIRETDFLGRLGGDEFAIILTDLNEPAIIERLAQKMLESLCQPFRLEDDVAYVSASIGISLYPHDSARLEELLKHADQAMYAAKHLGRNRYSYFTPALQEAAQRRIRMGKDLRVALSEKQFSLHYQPIVDLTTGDVHKAEALIRWLHPEQGFISPVNFIPVAEEAGLIIEIGNWVFGEATRQLKQWRHRYMPTFQISINKSPVQFRDESARELRHWLTQMGELGLPGDSVSIEITESLLMDASVQNIGRFQMLRDAGIQVSLDDFGTGYSALSYLQKFDIDYLKIDQSFVRNLAPDSDQLALCEAIIVMAHKLHLKVIAEGIETEQQRDLLRKAGCDYGQGYLFARPMPADEFEKLLSAEGA